MRILVADDDPQMQLAIKTSLSRAGHDIEVVSNGKAALENVLNNTFDLVVSDQRMPEMTGLELLEQIQEKELKVPLVMITAYGTINQAVDAMQRGASDFITKPFSSDDLLRVVERVVAIDDEIAQSSSAKTKQGRPIITRDSVMIRVLEVCEAVARSDATVLVQGESGTGKELIARLVHSASPRSKQSFVAVNCAALPESLLESELFGHEKGAFTGAQAKKVGKFELAHGGTILLDEISEMELPLQAKLLRVLQEREVDRVGGKEPIPIDVRVVATTNKRLEDLVSAGKFRADLFYRLNVIPITLPPLRERKGDVELLVKHFMRMYLDKGEPQLSSEVIEALNAYRWPGNVRELQNAVERAAVLSRGAEPKESDFMLGLNGDVAASMGSEKIESNEESEDPEDLRIKSGVTVQEMERSLIIETLKATNNNRTQAAKMLGISIRTLRNKLNEYKTQGLEIE